MDDVAALLPSAATQELCAAHAQAVDVSLELLATARTGAVLAGHYAVMLGLLPADCPYRSGPLYDAYHHGRYLAGQALGGGDGGGR